MLIVSHLQSRAGRNECLCSRLVYAQLSSSVDVVQDPCLEKVPPTVGWVFSASINLIRRIPTDTPTGQPNTQPLIKMLFLSDSRLCQVDS